MSGLGNSLQQQLLSASPEDYAVGQRLAEGASKASPLYFDFHFLHDTATGMYAFGSNLDEPKSISETLTIRTFLQALLLSGEMENYGFKSNRLTPMHSAECFSFIRSLVATSRDQLRPKRAKIAADFVLDLDRHRKFFWGLRESERRQLQNLQVTESLLIDRRGGPLMEFFTILFLMRGNEYSNYPLLLKQVAAQRIENTRLELSDIYSSDEFDQILDFYSHRRRKVKPTNNYHDAASLVYLHKNYPDTEVFYLAEDLYAEKLQEFVRKFAWDNLTVITTRQVTLGVLMASKPSPEQTPMPADVAKDYRRIERNELRVRVANALNDKTLWEDLTSDKVIQSVIGEVRNGDVSQDDESIVSLFGFLSEELLSKQIGDPDPFAKVPEIHKATKSIVNTLNLLAPPGAHVETRMMSLGLYKVIGISNSHHQQDILSRLDNKQIFGPLFEFILYIQSGTVAFISEKEGITSKTEADSPGLNITQFVRLSAILLSGIFQFDRSGLNTKKIRRALYHGCMSAFYYALMRRERPKAYPAIVSNLLWSASLYVNDHDEKEDPVKTLRQMLGQVRLILDEGGFTIDESGPKLKTPPKTGKVSSLISQGLACYAYGMVVCPRSPGKLRQAEDREFASLLNWFRKHESYFHSATVALVSNLALYQLISKLDVHTALRRPNGKFTISNTKWRQMEAWYDLLQREIKKGFICPAFLDTTFFFHAAGMLAGKPGYEFELCEQGYQGLQEFVNLDEIKPTREAWESYKKTKSKIEPPTPATESQ